MTTKMRSATQPRVLHTEQDLEAAMAAVDSLLERDPKPGSKDAETLELLAVLIEDYESRTLEDPPAPTPQAAVAFMLEQKNLSRSALAPVLGGRSRVSEFFAGKRPLSTSQIRALRGMLGIPADLLIGAP